MSRCLTEIGNELSRVALILRQFRRIPVGRDVLVNDGRRHGSRRPVARCKQVVAACIDNAGFANRFDRICISHILST